MSAGCFRIALSRVVMCCVPFLLGSAAGAPGAHAQDYPSRSVRLVVPSAAGGGTDIIARHLAQRLTERFRHPVFVENRTGAGSLVGTDFVAKAPADGHTLLMGGLFNIVMNSALLKNLPYDPLRDFVVVDYISAYPFILLARKDLPATTLKEFVAYAKERPGKLNYGSAGLGTLHHVWGTILLKSLGLDMVHVPYKGAAAAQQDLIGGRVDVLFDNLSAAKAHVQSGLLKALAVSSAARSATVPDVPTINETGLVRFEGESWFGVFAPTGTPPAAIEPLGKAIGEIVRDPEVVAVVQRDAGRMLSIPPDQRAAWLRNEVERWSAMVHTYAVSAQ